VQDDEGSLGRGLDDIGPDCAGLDARAPCPGVDLDTAQARRLQEDRVVEYSERARTVAGSLRGDPQAVCARELDDLDDVLDGVHLRDHRRPLVDREVPRLAGVVPPWLSGKDEVAVPSRARRTLMPFPGSAAAMRRVVTVIVPPRRIGLCSRPADHGRGALSRHRPVGRYGG
jgi:hypothetical protein